MDKVVTRYFKIGTIGFVVAKVLGDELLFGPIHVGGYFAWMTLAEGGSWQVIELEFSQFGSLVTLLQKQSSGSSTNDICASVAEYELVYVTLLQICLHHLVGAAILSVRQQAEV